MFRHLVSMTVTITALSLPLSAALACGPEGHDHHATQTGTPGLMQVAQAETGHQAHQHGKTAHAPQHVVKIGTLDIEAPWSRATPGGAKVGAGYLRITNTGPTADWLTGGTFPRAERVEIHEMALRDGVMTMRPLPDGLEIAPGQTVTLAPGGYHLMFMGLKTPLKEGETVSGTLNFRNAGQADVTYTVRSLAAGGGRGH